MKKVRNSLLPLGIAFSAFLTACGNGTAGSDTQTTESGQTAESVQTAEKEQKEPVIIGTWQAEDAALEGNVKVEKNKSGYTGDGYISGIQNDDDGCLFTIEITEGGFFDLNFISVSEGGYKENFISVDGESVGSIVTEDAEFADSYIRRVYLEAGTHEIEVVKSWGWICLDCLVVSESEQLDPAIYEVKTALCNKNASEEARRLYSYLCDIYGEKILSGQYCDTGGNGKEFQVVKKATGKTPAVLGLDFIEYTPSRVENGSTGHATDLALNFWENGGIVTFCWHWNAPSPYLTGQWYSGFYTDSTNIDLAKIMNGEDKEGYDLLMKDIDAIAEQLLILKEAHVPILWRPLHEASGGWFWWGASGPEPYIQLYKLLYERLTNEYGLDNLIWVWNGQDAAWYPGDEYVDIIGEDIYPGEKVYTSQIDAYLNAAQNYAGETKLVYLTENGCVFDPELAKRDGAMWGMWCTWQGEFVARDTAIFTLSEQYTEEAALIKAYEDEDVLTLEDLPDLATYEMREEFKQAD
ncbi:MAG: beta-mannosidase [Roseburia sp.]|nr:beta-mannosidase [Roseburia sp.]MCM1242173.1 beta-mannosidase [Roseburia sp.]